MSSNLSNRIYHTSERKPRPPGDVLLRASFTQLLKAVAHDRRRTYDAQKVDAINGDGLAAIGRAEYTLAMRGVTCE